MWRLDPGCSLAFCSVKYVPLKSEVKPSQAPSMLSRRQTGAKKVFPLLADSCYTIPTARASRLHREFHA
jgi:hypothetical protein